MLNNTHYYSFILAEQWSWWQLLYGDGGLHRVIDFLYTQNLEIDVLVTDRHKSINKWLVRETHPSITHYFDTWHVAKGMWVIPCEINTKIGWPPSDFPETWYMGSRCWDIKPQWKFVVEVSWLRGYGVAKMWFFGNFGLHCIMQLLFSHEVIAVMRNYLYVCIAYVIGYYIKCGF